MPGKRRLDLAATQLENGGSYAVTVFAQPSNPKQACTVGNGGGTVNGADVSNVSVACSTLPDVVFKDGFED